VRAEADAMADAVVEQPKEIRLTPEQEAALTEIEKGGVVLLHGVTGSGKTEVYLRAIGRVVAQGKQAIVLVPEIALTPQTLARFKARFERVAVLHSVLTESDRAGQWRAIRAGEVDVVVGARSAVFAPTRALGLIVVDEEHEGAYKQENAPRYHAREVAVHRARAEGAAAVLGSATPSLESYHRARQGEYRMASLPRRIGGREMPVIEVVDMAAERAEVKHYPVISRRLEELIREASAQGEQVLLFLNRRGFLTHVSCPRCHWVLRCGRCDVTLTYHQKTDRAACHYCNRETPLPEACPDCHSGKLLRLGIGTERIEEEMRRLFPGRQVSRMDSDAMRTKRDYRASLGALWRGETDILVGTQMIAKGLDVPDVTLVGVTNADTAFHLPDFRAAERTFQLITQVAGRTGRGPRGGRVVVQTFNPNHYAIRQAAGYDYEGFADRELEMRRELGYPPFVPLVRLVVQGAGEDAVRRAAERLGEKLKASFDEEQARVLGPAPAHFHRLKGRYRMHLLVKASSFETVLPLLRRFAEDASRGRALQVLLDVDPVSML
jgi:primosomal protein N' (replication factor Y)